MVSSEALANMTAGIFYKIMFFGIILFIIGMIVGITVFIYLKVRKDAIVIIKSPKTSWYETDGLIFFRDKKKREWAKLKKYKAVINASKIRPYLRKLGKKNLLVLITDDFRRFSPAEEDIYTMKEGEREKIITKNYIPLDQKVVLSTHLEENIQISERHDKMGFFEKYQAIIGTTMLIFVFILGSMMLINKIGQVNSENNKLVSKILEMDRQHLQKYSQLDNITRNQMNINNEMIREIRRMVESNEKLITTLKEIQETPPNIYINTNKIPQQSINMTP